MMLNYPADLNAWTIQMEDLVNRTRRASKHGASPASPIIQTIVDNWIQLFADTMHLPNTRTFFDRFFGYAQQSETEPSQTLWNFMMRLNPDRLVPQYRAQKLMMEGLRWKMSQLPQGSSSRVLEDDMPCMHRARRVTFRRNLTPSRFLVH